MTHERSVETAAAMYEPPRVEAVLTPEDRARETHYAGIPSNQGPG